MNTLYPNPDHAPANIGLQDYNFITLFSFDYEGMPVPNDEPPYYLDTYPAMSLDDLSKSARHEDRIISSMNNTARVNPSSRSFSSPGAKEMMRDLEAHCQGSANFGGHDDPMMKTLLLLENPSMNWCLPLSIPCSQSSSISKSPFNTSKQRLVTHTHNDPISISASSAATSAESSPQVDLNLDTVIGTIRLNGDIMCQYSGCRLPFGRLAELKRHYATSHAVQKPEFWCNVPDCPRSMLGGRPFHRMDKLGDHERKIHQCGAFRIGKR